MTRSRAGRKNDNCYVEQKNFDTVRKLVGYARFATQPAVDALNELCRVQGSFRTSSIRPRSLSRRNAGERKS